MGSIIGNSRRPDVTFYINGRIDITSRIAKQLCLTEGDVIDIDKRNGEYLLYVRYRSDCAIGRHEARCKASKNNSNNFRAYSKQLTDAILNACGAEKAQLASGAVVELEDIGIAVPLVTRNNLYDKRD
jgi:hypothetical protein